MRTATLARKTVETDISLNLVLDGTGEANVKSGIGFLDHMLTLFARHSGMNINLTCRGDVQVDDHHSVEDVGICLGRAFSIALGDKKGIVRYGDCLLPMDETLILSAVDISGRSLLVYDVSVPTEKVGTFDTELCEEFFRAFARSAEITLHIKKLSGENSHHILEGVFKSVARTLRRAAEIDERFSDSVPSTKGVL